MPPTVARFFAAHVPGGDVRARLLADQRRALEPDLSGRAAASDAWVLRRPPLGHVLPTAHDMAREYRVLAALADTDVPVARPIALCEDTAVNDMPFYVMEYRPGVVLAHALPPASPTTPDDAPPHQPGDGRHAGAPARDRLPRRRPRGLRPSRRLSRAPGAALGAAVGALEDRRRCRRSKRCSRRACARRCRRRRRRRSSTATSASAIWRSIPHDPGRVARGLRLGDGDARRSARRPRLHADLLGRSRTTSIDAGQHRQRVAVHHPARLPPPRRADRRSTRARSGRDVAAIDFYQVLALYKLAIISEGIYARYLQGKTLGEGFAGMVRPTEALATRALAIADASADRRLRG